MRLFQYLSSYAGNLKLSCNTSKYLQTVFNIQFCYENEEINGDFMVHTPAKFSTEVFDKIEANLFDFLKKNGFNSKRELLRGAGAIPFGMCHPNLSLEHYKLHSKIVAVHLLFDDYFDGVQLSRPENIDMVVRMTRALSEHFRGNASPLNGDIHAAFPKFVNVCQMYFEFGVSLLEIGRDLHYVYESFDKLVGGNVDQTRFGRAQYAEEYLKRKNVSSGMFFYFDLYGVLTGETLTDEVRNSTVFKKFRNLTAEMCNVSIDSISIVHDLLDGAKNDNYSALLTEQGFSVKDAVHYSINRYNQLFIQSLGLIAELNRMNICESDRRYLRLYLFPIRACLESAATHAKYNPKGDLKYKEIDDENRVVKCVADALHAVSSI